jgi:hypothetical protein
VATPLLEVRVHLGTTPPLLTAYCANFEDGEWRMRGLVDDVFYRHLLSFALSYTSHDRVDGDSAPKAISRAAQSVYNTDKYKSRGEFGELFLHAILRDFYGAHPAVSKIYFKDSDNDTVKGFDSVHLVHADDQVELWLGEVKFYADLSDAIGSVCEELETHLRKKYLRREFVAITSKLDERWPDAGLVEEMLDDNKTLDKIVDSLVIPVLLTYESTAVNAHDVLTESYIDELTVECEAALKRFGSKIKHKRRVRIELILLPIKNKKELVDYMHEKLVHWQAI